MDLRSWSSFKFIEIDWYQLVCTPTKSISAHIYSDYHRIDYNCTYIMYCYNTIIFSYDLLSKLYDLLSKLDIIMWHVFILNFAKHDYVSTILSESWIAIEHYDCIIAIYD